MKTEYAEGIRVETGTEPRSCEFWIVTPIAAWMLLCEASTIAVELSCVVNDTELSVKAKWRRDPWRTIGAVADDAEEATTVETTHEM